MAINRPSNVEFHIEELLLAGFSASQRRQIGDAVEAELTRLLGEAGVDAFPGRALALDRLDAGKIRIAPGSPAQHTGSQIARALMCGLAPSIKSRRT